MKLKEFDIWEYVLINETYAGINLELFEPDLECMDINHSILEINIDNNTMAMSSLDTFIKNSDVSDYDVLAYKVKIVDSKLWEEKRRYYISILIGSQLE